MSYKWNYDQASLLFMLIGLYVLVLLIKIILVKTNIKRIYFPFQIKWSLKDVEMLINIIDIDIITQFVHCLF